MTSRPPVGDFRSTPDNKPRGEAPKPVSSAPSAPSAPAARPVPPTDTEPSPPEDVLEKELTPRERYDLRLIEGKISRELANAIFDAIMTKDYYEEYVKIGQHRAVFRTRLYDDNLRLQTALEMKRPNLILSQEDMITRYNMAASLYEWKGVTYKHDNDDDFDKVLTLLRRMPGPIYSLLAQKLAEFDRKVMTVFSDGATDSF